MPTKVISSFSCTIVQHQNQESLVLLERFLGFLTDTVADIQSCDSDVQQSWLDVEKPSPSLVFLWKYVCKTKTSPVSPPPLHNQPRSHRFSVSQSSEMLPPFSWDLRLNYRSFSLLPTCHSSTVSTERFK